LHYALLGSNVQVFVIWHLDSIQRLQTIEIF
jgi:hypothetical protein